MTYYDLPADVNELFTNGERSYSITDPDTPGNNIYGVQLFCEYVDIPAQMIVEDYGTQIVVEKDGEKLVIDSGGLGDFHLHGFDVSWYSE